MACSEWIFIKKLTEWKTKLVKYDLPTIYKNETFGHHMFTLLMWYLKLNTAKPYVILDQEKKESNLRFTNNKERKCRGGFSFFKPYIQVRNITKQTRKPVNWVGRKNKAYKVEIAKTFSTKKTGDCAATRCEIVICEVHGP